MADSPARQGRGPEVVAELAARLAETCAGDPRNRLKDYGIRSWDRPPAGIAPAADPVLTQLKEREVIGPHHLTPEEWFPGAKSVASYFLQG